MFGAFTSVAFNRAKQSVYDSDPTAFLFSLVNTHGRSVKLTLKKHEVECAVFHAPVSVLWFGKYSNLC